jgi:DNA-binding response OmpR family regulator
MDERQHVLVVEDELAIAEGLVDLCVFKGYRATHVADGESGLKEALSGNYDLVILDVMLPGMSGFQVCEAVREKDRELPIIILTALGSESDQVEGLRLGADDYVMKPFHVATLFARIEAVLRRVRKNPYIDNELVLGDMTINFKDYEGKTPKEKVPFTRKEIEILEHLYQNRKKVVSRQELLEEVWGYQNADSVDTRTVDIHITKIRKKVEPNPAKPVFLITHRGEGYQLRLD